MASMASRRDGGASSRDDGAGGAGGDNVIPSSLLGGGGGTFGQLGGALGAPRAQVARSRGRLSRSLALARGPKSLAHAARRATLATINAQLHAFHDSIVLRKEYLG